MWANEQNGVETIRKKMLWRHNQNGIVEGQMTKRNAHSKHYYAQNVRKRTNCVMFARCRVILHEVTRCYEMSQDVTRCYKHSHAHARTHTRTHARTHAGTLLSLSSVRVLRHWGEMVHACAHTRTRTHTPRALLCVRARHTAPVIF